LPDGIGTPLMTVAMGQEQLTKTSCQLCKQPIEFPIEGLGITVACPHCGQNIILCEGTDLSQIVTSLTAGELKAAFTGAIPKSEVPIFYQIALFLVAIFMILLPLIYVSFVASVARGVYWYAVHAKVLLGGFTGGLYVFLFKVVAYFGPIFGGSVAVFFMFKPLFARPPKRPETLILNPAVEPKLFQFIAHLSDLLSAPMPKRIEMDCELNASAHFRRGWLSFFGNDLVLTIGLPLAAGMDARQLAAVVAHEFGHFTQGTAMRLGYVIDRINRWFMRVVYERDSWDETLHEWSNSAEDSRITIVLACAHIAVWFSRQILKLLMLCGHAASCSLSKQMEFHADSCAINVSGSQKFETMLIRLREQSILHSLTYQTMQQFWEKKHQLPDNIPDYLIKFEKQMPVNFYDQARNTLLNETAGLWATHPTAAQRVKNCRQQAATGVFHLELPAAALFSNFIGTARTVTYMHYSETLRLPIRPEMLKPAQDFFKETTAAKT
jgi:Zn-dependent protease with chaperone function